MFYIIIKESESEEYKLNNIDSPEEMYDLLIYINNKLSGSKICRSYLKASSDMCDFIHSNTLILSWETENIKIGIGYLQYNILEVNPEPQFDKIKPYLDIIKNNFELLLLPYKTLVEHSSFVDGLKKLSCDTLATVMTQKCLTDPYVLLIEILGYDLSYMYQTYVYYLNSTIQKTEMQNMVDLPQISKDFFSNGYYGGKFFNDILFFYIQKRDLTPLNIKYTKYSSSYILS